MTLFYMHQKLANPKARDENGTREDGSPYTNSASINEKALAWGVGAQMNPTKEFCY